MKNNKNFDTYNQINKLFNIRVMKINEVINNYDLQDKSCLVLMAKPHIDRPKHPRRRKQSKIHKLESRVNSVESKIDLLIEEFKVFAKKQEQFNEFVIKQFKEHSWIK